MKRILLFIVTNLAVMLVLGIAASLLGVNRYLTANGLQLGKLLGLPFAIDSSPQPSPFGSIITTCSPASKMSSVHPSLTI